MNPNTAIIDALTLRRIVRWGLIFVAAFVAIWLIGLAIKTFKKATTKGGDDGGILPDGTPNPNVDAAYIDRIAKLVKTARDENDHYGPSSARCEATNNIVGMRNEEIVALVALCKAGYGFDLKGEINQWEGDGCFTIIAADKVDVLKDRLKNF